MATTKASGLDAKQIHAICPVSERKLNELVIKEIQPFQLIFVIRKSKCIIMKIKPFILACCILVSATLSAQESLSVGERAPLFKATADDGSTWNISDYIGSHNIVVYFYPAAMTSGCTAQACSYRDHIDDLTSADAIVVGISADKIESLKLFKQAENLNFPLLSDETGSIARSFGVPVGQGGSITRAVGGTEHILIRDVSLRRWTFVVGKDGTIIYKNDAVNPGQDSEEVLSFLNSLK